LVLFGTLFVVPYYLSAKQVGFGVVGLQLAVLPVAIGIAAPIAGRLLNRLGDRPVTAGGLILTSVGLLEIAVRDGTTGLLPGLVLAGLGLGLFTPANNATIISASPPGHTGSISGVLNMTRGIGMALKVALAGALYTPVAGVSGAHATPGAAAQGLSLALGVLASLALAVGVALLFLRQSRRAAALAATRF
jgi:MFS family permease